MPRPVYPIRTPFRPEFLDIALVALETLARDAVVFEWGSGNSTLWLAQRAFSVHSIEHDSEWYTEVVRSAAMYSLDVNVELIDVANYADPISIHPSCSLDLVIVDGLDRTRVDCVKKAVDKVKPGGYLVLDDSHWEMLNPAFRMLCDWYETVVFGERKRPSGEVRNAQTSFFRKAQR